MSLSDVIPMESLLRLAELEEEDVKAITSAVTLGYSPQMFFEALQSIKAGNEPALPRQSGQPKTLTVNAWSFVNDKQQYSGVYSLSPQRAAELKELLLRDPDTAASEIHAIVAAAISGRKSNKGVHVSLNGMPGSSSGDSPGSLKGLNAQLKIEIATQGARYGQYKFTATATPYGGPHAFSVPLGAGFSAYFANKVGAVDVARIASVHGRFHQLVDGYVGFLSPGSTSPKFGSSIPEKVTWDCVQGPSDPLRPAPRSVSPTTAQ